MDLVRIFEQYPEWHAGLKRLDISRETVRVDHLTPRGWSNDAVAAHASIPHEWYAGRDSGTAGLVQILGISGVDWTKHWSVPGSNIQCPDGGGKFVGVDLLDMRESSSMANPCGESTLPRGSGTGPVPASSDHISISLGSPAGLDSDQPMDFDEGHEDAVALATTPNELGKARAHSTFYEGKLYHNATLTRLIFNDNTHHRQLKDRLSRVRTYTTPTVSLQLSSMAKDSCIVGDRVATVVQVGKKAYMALVQITHLYQAGSLIYGVRRSELVMPESKIELRGQVIDLQPSTLHSPKGPIPVFVWKGGMVKLRPASGGQKANNVFALRFPASTAIDLSSFDLCPSTTDNSLDAAGLVLGGLIFDVDRLCALLEHISQLWSAPTATPRKISTCHPDTPLFPYRKHNARDSM
jgi:hypothetical protein